MHMIVISIHCILSQRTTSVETDHQGDTKAPSPTLPNTFDKIYQEHKS